jgi:hypothetical protein
VIKEKVLTQHNAADLRAGQAGGLGWGGDGDFVGGGAGEGMRAARRLAVLVGAVAAVC